MDKVNNCKWQTSIACLQRDTPTSENYKVSIPYADIYIICHGEVEAVPRHTHRTLTPNHLFPESAKPIIGDMMGPSPLVNNWPCG